MVRLAAVRTMEEVREGIGRFASVALDWEYGRELVRRTRYWVHDPATGNFGPSKFVGFFHPTPSRYEAALLGKGEGSAFDGHVSRRAIETALGTSFKAHPRMAWALKEWVRRALGEDALSGIDQTKVKFIVLPRRDASNLGKRYVPVDETASSGSRAPFAVDPDKVDRGTRAHKRTQNALASFLKQHGIEAKAPTGREPEYDLAWQTGSVTYVAEIKSVTRANEERQLRLGLGQVLRYRHQLAATQRGEVVGVLAIERKPRDRDWPELCARLNVRLVWPEVFNRLV